MATARVIEEESGTSRSWYHRHNGYYAGSFSAPVRAGVAPSATGWHPDAVHGSAPPSVTPTGSCNRSTTACSPAR